MELSMSNISSASTGNETRHVKLLILGAGPAGLSAALYAARAELEPVVLTGIEIGGQASLTFTIENYPGFPEGVGGAQLGELFQKQAERFGAKIEFDTANSVDFSQRPYRVSAYNAEYLADSVIIATGASPVHLNVDGEERLTGKGVSYCATCDGWFFKNKKVVVVGGGDSALEESLFLTRYASSVTIVHRRDAFRAGAILQKRVNENPKIELVLSSTVSEVKGDGKVTSIKLNDLQNGHASEFDTDGIFIFIGHHPNTQLFKDYLEMDELGYIKIDLEMKTSLPGVFAAGEAADPHYRQVVTSAGMGAAAAIQATRFLSNQ
jgi:thioredoxin reductase (NADPH)